MRQHSSLLWVVILVGAILAGCGDEGDSATAEPDSAGSETATDGDEGEGAGAGESDPGATSGETTGPVSGGELVYGIISDGTGFNTTDTMGEGAVRIAGALTDALTTFNADGEVVPTILESFEANDDATRWTLTVRDGITFHDGEPVDAAAIEANLSAFKSSPSVGFALNRVSGFNVVDDRTLEVEMSSPWASFPATLAAQPGFIVSPSTIGQPNSFVGTGPFVLESWSPGDTAVAVRNENYWLADEGLPYLDKITFKVIGDQSARRQALEAGDIDAYYAPGDNDVLDFNQTDEIDFYENAGESNEMLYILNTTTPPTDDVRVRRALALSLDRDLLIENFRSGLTIPASSFISPSSPFWVETDYPQYDPEAAAALVEEYEAENGPIEFDLKVSNTAQGMEVAEVVVSFWNEAGMDVTIEAIQPGTEVPPVIADAFSAIQWVQFSGVDPDREYVFFHSSGGALNWSNLVDERMDEAFELGRTSADLDERKAAYATVQEVFAEQVPIIWIDHLGPVEGVAATPEVHDLLNQTTPGGDPHWGFVGGSFFPWAQVWKG